jgi:UDP-N-acetyl-D-galactosamine dehydrogenase
MKFSSNMDDLRGCTFFVVAVPTPVDVNNLPDLSPVVSASRTVGKVLQKGAVVVFESTVYPGVTEDICGPVLAKESGLVQGKDFKLGYSPERINPGDKEHTLERITKVVSGEDAETLERVSNAYGAIIEAGVHREGPHEHRP